MRKNKKVPKKLSVTTENAICFGGVILITFVMVIINLLASSSCQHLMKSIGEKERQLASLEETRVRQSARWEEMKTPERLENALLKFGLMMKYPKASQVVRMGRNGKPVHGQISVARAGQRGGAAGQVALTRRSDPSSRAPTVRQQSRYRRAR